ncbi:uncharacterized protein LOC143299120 [Babylonia areolata]|uniref:uncharacterized protein LOC143299120 n=1 Tax=Babylonia areolata TaxID=304850 RepID=UPI003FD2BEE8
MKALLVVSLLCLVAGNAAAPDKRFLFDTVSNVFHAVVDPFANLLSASVHTLVKDFDVLVNGQASIQTVVCKLPMETGGTKEEKISACVTECKNNAEDFLGDAAGSANESCPIACTYAYAHPTQYTC